MVQELRIPQFSRTDWNAALDEEWIHALGRLILPTALSVILVPLVIYVARYAWARRRWHAFQELIRAWAEAEWEPESLNGEEWNALVVTKLSDAGFERPEIKEYLDLAVLLAKARASEEILGRIRFPKEGEHGHGHSERPNSK